MKYQNRVASAIKPEIYEVPFIGGNAFKVQLEQAKLKKKELKQEINDFRERKAQLENTIKWLETEADIDIKYRLDTIPNLMQVQKSIALCRENIKTLEKNSNFIQKQVQLETLEKIRKELAEPGGTISFRWRRCLFHVESRVREANGAKDAGTV